MTPKQRATKARKALMAFEDALNKVRDVNRDREATDGFLEAEAFILHGRLADWVRRVETEAQKIPE